MFMAKNTLLLLAVATTILIVGAGCAKQDTVSPTDNSPSSTTVAATTTELMVSFPIKELGITLSIPVEYKDDLAYEIKQSSQNIAYFYSKSALEKYASCGPGSVGAIIKGTKTYDLEGIERAPVIGYDIKIGNEYITIDGPQDRCTSDDVLQDAILARTNALRQALPTVRALAASSANSTTNWKTYTNSTVGFTFKYPTNASEADQSGIKDSGLVFGVTINNLNTMQDAPLGYDKANALKDKTALSKGDPSTSFGQAMPSSLKMLSITNVLAKELTILQQLEVCNVQFNRQAIIYKDNYQIILSWVYAGSDIENNNAHYFKTDSVNCGETSTDWSDSNKFYADLVAGKTDSVSQKWFTDFDAVIKTLQFTK